MNMTGSTHAGYDPDRLHAVRAREDALFRSRIPRSLELAVRARRSMPNGVPMAWMAGLYRHPPLFVVDGSGAWFRDVDGHTYLDMNQADLSMNCGYGSPPIITAGSERLRQGSQFLLPTEDAIVVSELLAERFGVPFWQYTLSASSANTEALRLARVATGRDRIVVFQGAYHGHLDDTLVERAGTTTVPGLLGTSAQVAQRTRVVPFNRPDALVAALAPGDVAAVITEPALTNVGVVQPAPDFHAYMRSITHQMGTLLILDETHTQMAAWGGLTRELGLEPDMVTLGKSLGGGIAIGAYGMSEPLAQVMERYLDIDIGPPGLATGGTMYANALCLATARAVLQDVLTREGYQRVNAPGARLADGIERAASTHGLAWRAHRLGGRSGFCLRPTLPRDAEDAAHSLDSDFIDTRRVFMANRGIWEAIATAGPAASFAHTATDIDRYLGALSSLLDEIS
jgi:glutamate-1-semialdehyde 2,1-aminomutase